MVIKMIKWFGYESEACPNCGSTDTWYIGNGYYKCRDCNHEWNQ